VGLAYFPTFQPLSFKPSPGQAPEISTKKDAVFFHIGTQGFSFSFFFAEVVFLSPLCNPAFWLFFSAINTPDKLTLFDPTCFLFAV